MGLDLQKASMWKRISAYILDMILLCILAVGFGAMLSQLLGFDRYNQQLNARYTHFEQEYGVVFDITPEEYEAKSTEEKAAYDAANQALTSDEEALYAYNMVIHLSLVILSVGILLAYLCLEFGIPLLLGNGQTVGKKVFAIGLMRTDGVKVRPFALFVRAVLGKFAIETMIPVIMVMMCLFGTIGVLGTLIVCILLFSQLAVLAFSANRSAIHDLLACTVAVDLSSQMIFEDEIALLDYKKRIHAEYAAREDY